MKVRFDLIWGDFGINHDHFWFVANSKSDHNLSVDGGIIVEDPV